MSDTRYDYLIVGNSTAAAAAAEAIREHDGEGTMALVSDQTSHIYSPPLISYVLGGKIPEANLFHKPRDFYRQVNAAARLGVCAETLDPAGRQLRLADGVCLGYEKLLLACGGTPIVPDMPGTDLQGVHTFTRYEDMVRVREHISRHGVTQAVVVGGGMIGVKAAEALALLGIETTLVELMDRVLAQALDATGSQMARQALERKGIRVITSTAVSSIGGHDNMVQGVTLDSGSRLPAQLVVVAVGVRPNVKLAADAGLEVNRGVLVDEQMRTSDAHVYAAGDVAEAWDPLQQERRPIAIWPGAHMQGAVAGANMTGCERCYEGSIAMNSIQVCGLPTMSVGMISPPENAETLEYQAPDKSAYRRFFITEGRIVGAIFVGDVDRAGIITGLIRQGIDVTAFKDKLMQRDMGLLALPKTYRKHMVSGPGIEV